MGKQKYVYDRATYVDPFPGREDAEITGEEHCGRCGGTGGFKCYGHIDGGKCFECHGTGGHRKVTVGMERKRAKAEVARVNRHRLATAKRQLQHAANMASAIAARPEWKRAAKCENEFIAALWLKAYKYELTERQIEAGADAIIKWGNRAQIKADAEAIKAAMTPLEPGRRVISGRVVSVKSEESAFGYNVTTVWKMLLELETGHRLWGSIPSALWDLLNADREDRDPWAPMDSLKGRAVSFTAAVSPSENDPSFGFYSRPTKPVLEPVE